MKKIASYISLIFYLSFLFWRMFYYAFGNFYRIPYKAPQYNIVPFKTIFSLIKSFSKYDIIVWIYNLLGNVIVFIPLGFLLYLILSYKNKKQYTLILSFFIILFAETMQLVLRVGVFDIDDIILNLIGSYIGFLMMPAIRWLKSQKL